jgi:predicted nucleotidyltransferase
MAGLDATAEGRLAAFASAVRAALGERLECLALYGSGAAGDWVPGRSDLNVAVVVPSVTVDVLEALAPVVARARRDGFAPPALLDREYLARARDTFPMELDDIRRQHRLLAGTDVFAAVSIEPLAVRRECEREARGKLLRLRALFLEAAGAPAALEALVVESLKSFLVVLRHLLRLRHAGDADGYRAVLDAGERLLGALPAMRRALDHRDGVTRLSGRALRADFGAYLAEVERIVAAVDALDA